jgi:hypothetical protein
MGFFMQQDDHNSGAVSFDFVLENQTRLYQGKHKGVLKELYAEQFDRKARTVTFTSCNTEPYHEVPFDEVSELAVLPPDAADFVYAHRDDYIQATVGDVEGVFYAAEHFNYGRGHMMLERDGKIRGVVSSSQLQNPVSLGPHNRFVSDFGKTSLTCAMGTLTRPAAVRSFSLENPEESREGRLVFCIEDPVEYAIPSVTHVQLRGAYDTPVTASEQLAAMLAKLTRP